MARETGTKPIDLTREKPEEEEEQNKPDAKRVKYNTKEEEEESEFKREMIVARNMFRDEIDVIFEDTDLFDNLKEEANIEWSEKYFTFNRGERKMHLVFVNDEIYKSLKKDAFPSKNAIPLGFDYDHKNEEVK